MKRAVELKFASMQMMIWLFSSSSTAYEMRPIRVNKSLLPSNLESLHERHWKVYHRRENVLQRFDDEKDFEIEEVIGGYYNLLMISEL